jgi:hypothetical protein
VLVVASLGDNYRPCHLNPSDRCASTSAPSNTTRQLHQPVWLLEHRGVGLRASSRLPRSSNRAGRQKTRWVSVRWWDGVRAGAASLPWSHLLRGLRSTPRQEGGSTMQYRTPQGAWFSQRAEECRAQAKFRASRENGFLRLASAYEKLAEATEQSAEIHVRHPLYNRRTTATPA